MMCAGLLRRFWRRAVAIGVSPVGFVFVTGVSLTVATALSTDIGALLPSIAYGNVEGLVAYSDGIGQYLAVFILSAIPLVEILVVIPIGIVLGMDPVGVGLFAFLGNTLPIVAIVICYDRLESWRSNRTHTDIEPTKRKKRAVALWNRYGLPGLAIVSPVATGVHLAVIIALALGGRKRSVVVWMVGTILVWTVLLTIASHYGVGYALSLRL